MGSNGNIAALGGPPGPGPAGGITASVSSTQVLNPFARVAPIHPITITTAMVNTLNNHPTFKPLDMTIDNW